LVVKIISDIHGEYDALSSCLRQSDVAVLLGDYLNLIDFRSLNGILAEVYSREQIAQALGEIARGRKEYARSSIRDITGADPSKQSRVRELILESYERFFACLKCKCLLIYGNTDNPDLMREVSCGKAEVIECGVETLDGQKFGFISGAPCGPWSVGLPGEMASVEYAKLVSSLGPVDVLCTHYPPAISELTWDTEARRDEEGSLELLRYIEEYSPERHYFGHVHNPASSSAVHGKTTCINAGFFKERRTVLIHRQ